MHAAMTQSNANHAVQAMVELDLDFGHVAFIRDALEQDLPAYSANMHACRVIQAFVKVYGGKLNVCLLLNNDSHLWLSGLTFGNYVIQCIIKRGTSYSNDAVIARFRRQLITDVFADSDQLLLLSKDKHGSNVIEACIRAAEEPDLDVLVGNICKKCGYLLRELIRGEFSNYVPKTLIKFCNRSQQEE